MRRHGISPELIEHALLAPDWREPSVGGRINCWKRVADRYLRVTYREEPEEIVVIAAVFKRRCTPGGPGA